MVPNSLLSRATASKLWILHLHPILFGDQTGNVWYRAGTANFISAPYLHNCCDANELPHPARYKAFLGGGLKQLADSADFKPQKATNAEMASVYTHVLL